jgi:hypothetical protein
MVNLQEIREELNYYKIYLQGKQKRIQDKGKTKMTKEIYEMTKKSEE